MVQRLVVLQIFSYKPHHDFFVIPYLGSPSFLILVLACSPCSSKKKSPTISDGILHSLFSGTCDSSLNDSVAMNTNLVQGFFLK